MLCGSSDDGDTDDRSGANLQLGDVGISMFASTGGVSSSRGNNELVTSGNYLYRSVTLTPQRWLELR